ncbi:MAG: zinc-dependent alcohol dehydrogenase [Thermomicrobiales bacterium]
MHARSLLLEAPRSLRWVDADLPAPVPDEALVRTTAGAISIGSELPFYRGEARTFLPPSYPKMTGYENVGRIVEVGANVSGLSTGDRVVATYGHRTAALIRASSAIKIPDEIDDALAILLIPTCDVAKGIAKLRPSAGEPILVTGGGAIGLLTIWSLVQQGFGPVDLVEPIESRRNLALALGVRHAWRPEDAPSSPSYPVGLECSSANAGFGALQRAMRLNGRICVLADGLREPLTLSAEFHERELTIVGSSDGLDYRDHARWYYPAALHNGANLRRLFDLTVNADDLPATFTTLSVNPHAAIKVLVRYRTEPAG